MKYLKSFKINWRKLFRINWRKLFRMKPKYAGATLFIKQDGEWKSIAGCESIELPKEGIMFNQRPLSIKGEDILELINAQNEDKKRSDYVPPNIIAGNV